MKKILFDPLGMKDTDYLPSPALKSRIAPTEMQKDGVILRGVVHDPTARYMGGVAGHAGVFSTADDLGKFCQMILDGGGDRSCSIRRRFGYSPRPHTPPNQPILRGLGWDIQSPYSGVRGELISRRLFWPHWFYRHFDLARSRFEDLCHSADQFRPSAPEKSDHSAAGRVATIVAGVGRLSARTRTGLDVLEQNDFKIFRGKRIGLITNQTGVDRQGRRNVDVMRAAGVDIVALFSPEHGLAGVEDRPNLGDAIDTVTGIKVWSLYGKTLRPTPEMLRGLDALVFDIQDVGVRFYTYESTMLYAMEEAAKAKLPFYVLDRPNPITGIHVEGPMLDPDKLSFTGSFPAAACGMDMTIGELARLITANSSWTPICM